MFMIEETIKGLFCGGSLNTTVKLDPGRTETKFSGFMINS